MTLRVVHVTTHTAGGAGRAAASLHRAMLEQGLDSHLISGAGGRRRIAAQVDRFIWQRQHSPVRTWRSTARWGSLSAGSIEALRPDVVNLHWVTDGLMSVEEIGRLESPVVWTMHDMWSFTGTEHYTDAPASDGPPRWESGYTTGNRPADESGPDVDRWTWERKRRHWRRPALLVPVSHWLGDLARRSALLGTWPQQVIPNVIDTTAFAPADRSQARRALGLPHEAPLIAFIASAGINDARKGWAHLRDAVSVVQESLPDVGVIVIGPHAPTDDPRISAPVHWQGELHGDAAIARALAACDVLAVPSLTDNLPLTACEAQACGRAVVAFRVGGLPDIVDHQSTGYLAEPFSPQDLAAGLVQAIEDARGQDQWGRRARDRAVERWAGPAVVARYLEAYAQVTA